MIKKMREEQEKLKMEHVQEIQKLKEEIESRFKIQLD